MFNGLDWKLRLPLCQRDLGHIGKSGIFYFFIYDF